MNAPVLTLEDTLASQTDLSRLCSDRPLRTNEIFAPNAYYGNDLILKEYAGLPPSYRLKVVIPHGLIMSEDFIWKAEAKAPLPAVLCYSSHRQCVYASRANKHVFHSAYPFVYLVEMLKRDPAPERRGTIFFPAHSTHHVTAQMDFEAVAEKLLRLGTQYEPVTVCIYWRDFNLGHHTAFERRGLQIVSAGHMYDPAFLFRFYHLCSIHRHASSNSIGSSLFYSVKSGCSYFCLDSGTVSHIAEDHVLKRDVSSSEPARRDALESLFRTPRETTTAEQMEAVDYYLGIKYLKSPLELRRQLRHAELLDKVGFFVHNRGHKTRVVVPAFYKRTVMKQAGKAVRAGRRAKGLLAKTISGGTAR